MSESKDVVQRGYDTVSHRYRGDDDTPEHYPTWLRLLSDSIPEQADVLDLGCGCGVPMARDLTERGHRVLGVDLSAVQISRARRLVPGAEFRQADAVELAPAPDSLDAIVCLYVLIHLPRSEQETLIHRFGTWLRPGGILLATVGATAGTGTDPNWLDGGVPMWWDHPDADTYRTWLAGAGFTIDRDEFVPEGGSGHQLLIAHLR